MTTCPTIYSRYLGSIPYTRALALQSALVQARIRRDSPLRDSNMLLLLQHPPTYTAGRRIKGTAHTEGRRLRDLGADYYEVMRGGQTTFHGPGQLVGYPILDLRQYQMSVRSYVAALETCLIQTCLKYDVSAQTTPDTGVWVQGSKIAAIGVHVSRHIASHGFALNCNTDLSWFHHIVACGLADKTSTSLSHELNREITVQDTLKHVRTAFAQVFNAQIVDGLPPALEADFQKLLQSK
ncbi:lipoyl(octanoyl) transferase [Synchytrium microbalum]|uniref:Octanoyltransferase n=1 Tax=Synchytrium microbalum TaxID=1806994 RepID=A0A507C836_9FUNG|nr:lipoyl(octanoyl) transferase [Synchytrium microbalum]TPX35488.1 lipoyl(octanoyl) transferase [Synchytrium microbalum]